MISNVPTVGCFEETYDTLVYENRAKNIKTVATRNLLMGQNHIRNYAQLNQNQRQGNEELKLLIQQQQYHLQNPQLKLSQIKQKNPQGAQQSQKKIGFLIGIHYLQNVEDIIKNKIISNNILDFIIFERANIRQFEQMRFQERMDNAKNSKVYLKRSQDDLEQQFVNYEVQKVNKFMIPISELLTRNNEIE